MKTYKIELSSEPLREGCLTQWGVIAKYTNKAPYGSTLVDGTHNTSELKHLKCIKVEYFYPDITQSKEITDPAQLQKIWEAIRGEEPKKEWRLAHLDWQNFTLKEGAYQVESDYVPDNNGWISVKERMPELDEVVLVAHTKSTFTHEDRYSVDSAYFCSESKEWIARITDMPIESSVDLWFVYFWKPINYPRP